MYKGKLMCDLVVQVTHKKKKKQKSILSKTEL